MKKLILVVLGLAFVAPVFAAKKGKAPKITSERPVIIEYQGQATGS